MAALSPKTSPRTRVLGLCGLVLGFALFWGWTWWSRSRPTPPPSAPSAFAAPQPLGSAVPPPPRLLPPRAPDASRPEETWERIFAVDGDAQRDLRAMHEIALEFVRSAPAAQLDRHPWGENADLARALTDANVLGVAALPADHPALRDGQLIDRWGSPIHHHLLGRDHLELRSAGPDRRLYTGDDIVLGQITE
jgi:hypothetical protein